MKNESQKKLVIIIGVLLILTTIFAFVMGTDSNSPEEKKTEEPTILTPILKTETARLNDQDIFFTIQDIMNNFYTELYDNPANTLALLDKSFITVNKLDENNIYEHFDKPNGLVEFNLEEVYYNPDSNMTYYFIKGYTIDEIKSTNNLYYLIKVDMENNYSITPLKDIENLEEYIKNYHFNKVYLDNKTDFKIKEIDDIDKLISYINNFKKLMYLDIDKAYNMLNDATKSIYNDINVFTNDKDNIAEKLFVKFRSVNVQEENNLVIYTIKENNENSIIITEQNPNNYKIDFNFS